MSMSFFLSSFFFIIFSTSMYIMCLGLFSALSRRVGALQMSAVIIIIIIILTLLHFHCNAMENGGDHIHIRLLDVSNNDTMYSWGFNTTV